MYTEDLVLVAAIRIDCTGEKDPLGLVEGATENTATIPAWCWCIEASRAGVSPQAGHQRTRIETGFAVRIIRLSTSIPTATSPR